MVSVIQRRHSAGRYFLGRSEEQVHWPSSLRVQSILPPLSAFAPPGILPSVMVMVQRPAPISETSIAAISSLGGGRLPG